MYSTVCSSYCRAEPAAEDCVMTGMYTTEIFYIPLRLIKTAQKQNHHCTIKGTNIILTPVQSQLALFIAQPS